MKTITKKQKQILDALALPNARMIAPMDRPGSRIGYVTTTGSIHGYVCSVPLASKNILLEHGLIKELHGTVYLSKQQP